MWPGYHHFRVTTQRPKQQEDRKNRKRGQKRGGGRGARKKDSKLFRVFGLGQAAQGTDG